MFRPTGEMVYAPGSSSCAAADVATHATASNTPSARVRISANELHLLHFLDGGADEVLDEVLEVLGIARLTRRGPHELVARQVVDERLHGDDRRLSAVRNHVDVAPAVSVVAPEIRVVPRRPDHRRVLLCRLTLHGSQGDDAIDLRSLEPRLGLFRPLQLFARAKAVGRCSVDIALSEFARERLLPRHLE